MSEEYGPNFITLTDEDGNEIELEYVDALEHEGVTYMAFFPVEEEAEDAGGAEDGGRKADEADEEEEYGLIILRSEQENGEDFLSTIMDQQELNTVYELFMRQFLEDEET